MRHSHQEVFNKGKFVIHKGAQLFYKTYGKGPKSMIAFHGYGQNHGYFKNFAEALQNEYKVIAPDLFFHGKSTWPLKDKPIGKKEWALIIKEIIEKENVEKFSLTGFSMGGKFLLATMEAFPEQVDELIFIAPDGIKLNIWYKIATSQSGLRTFFKSIMLKPNRFLRLIKVMNSANVVNKRVLKFAASQMNTLEKRHRVYLSWTVFRNLKFELTKIAALINDNDIKTTFYLGKYDTIVTRDQIWRLLKRLKEYELKILDSGHSHLIEAVAKEMKRGSNK